MSKEDDFFKIIGIIIVSFFIIYIVISLFKMQTRVEPRYEGLENMGAKAGSAESYAAEIKARMIKVQDEMLVGKYRKEYESVIINLDDYIGFLMLQQVLKVGTDEKSIMAAMSNLATLKNAKESLNVTMSFLDKQ